MERYVIELVSKQFIKPNIYYYYEDITNNGISEEIFIRNSGNITMIEVRNDEGLVYNQWNLHGNVDFFHQQELYISGNYKPNNIKELYFFTLSNDSIFLHAIENPDSTDLFIENRFITTTGLGKISPDPNIISAQMDDLDGDGLNELIFGISSGFSMYPRRVFAYYIEKDSLAKSPESSYNIKNIIQADITGDGKNEIITSGVSTANVNPNEAKYHDYSNWLMVLDNNLEFVFEPVEIPGKSIYFKAYVFHNSEESVLAGITHNYRGGGQTKLYFFDKSGHIYDEQEFDFRISSSCLFCNKQGENILAVSNPDLGTYFFDSKFNLLMNSEVAFITGACELADLNSDGIDELICFDLINGRIMVICTSTYKWVALDENFPKISDKFIMSIKENKNESPEIFLQAESNIYSFRYAENPFFIFNHFVFWMLYFGLLGFTFVTRRLHIYQIKRKQDIKKKMMEMELYLHQNKADPNLFMSAINSVIHSIKDNDTEKAILNLQRFAALYNAMLFSLDEIQHSIEEEIKLCKEYLYFEKFVLDNRLDVRIKIDENVDLNRIFPEMLILRFTENIVKTFFSNLDNKGTIDIAVQKKDFLIEIKIKCQIRDNITPVNVSDNMNENLEAASKYLNYYNSLYPEKFSFEYHTHDNQIDTEGVCIIVKNSKKN